MDSATAPVSYAVKNLGPSATYHGAESGWRDAIEPLCGQFRPACSGINAAKERQKGSFLAADWSTNPSTVVRARATLATMGSMCS
jgi:hypothetical protein